MSLIRITIYALCKVLQLISEAAGYWFIILVWFAVSGLGITENILVWMVVLACALAAMNRTMLRITSNDQQAEKCSRCVYREAVSNHSPCYECKGNDKYCPEEVTE